MSFQYFSSWFIGSLGQGLLCERQGSHNFGLLETEELEKRVHSLILELQGFAAG